jgi:DNA repair protein SbcC/Rad50
MHITAVELENIKSHFEAKFEFPAGKISITGENGAGKTSIIEAIAWALFDSLEYKKEEFVRRGAKKGSVLVTFESGSDGRRYSVFRDTENSYYVFDPLLGAKFANRTDRLADKRDEVARFIRQHFGVEPGTDLKALFRQAIGVPQGTFTAIFLEGAAERKAAFDKLLKVEEYRLGAEKLLETARLIDNRIIDARLQIARIETESARVDLVEKEYQDISALLVSLGTDLGCLKNEVVTKREQVAALDLKEKQIVELNSAAERHRAERARAEIVFRQRESDLKASQEAAKRIETLQEGARRHTEVLARLTELERERQERENFRGQLAKVETAIVNVTADQKGIRQALENALKAHLEIEILRPKAVEQARLEKEIEALRDRYAHSRSIEDRIASLNEDLDRLRESYRQQQAKVKELEPTISAAGSLAELEKKDSATVRQMAALKAALERDQKFQSEVKNGLCPILSEKCLNLKEGQTLEMFITSQFSDIRARIDSLEKEKASVDASLKLAREAEKNITLLESIRARIGELTAEGKRLRAEKDSLEKRLEGAVEIERKLADADATLKALDNPTSRIKFYESDARRENDLRHEMTTIEKNLERLESERRLLVERLDEFKDLDLHWNELTAERDVTIAAHREFILHEPVAKLLGERRESFAVAERNLSDSNIAFVNAERNAIDAAAKYDAQLHARMRTSLIEAERKQAGSMAELEAAKSRERQLADELKHFAEIRETMKGELNEKERLQKVAEMTAFIRSTLKEAAPLVARNYVFLVSVEANQMFGEITGNAERTLKWNEDYGISLVEDGFERPFVALSGGEQMAAALSIRLAILKQLSDIRVAFFDEPTTNLDIERRENLAMQLSQIKSFDQLFVISHDDTFEGYVDHMISLDKAR